MFDHSTTVANDHVHVRCIVQVAQDIKKLCKVKPQLPWSASDTNIRKPKPAAAAAASKGGAGFGGGKGGFAKKAAKR
jgi:hypothetical protein